MDDDLDLPAEVPPAEIAAPDLAARLTRWEHLSRVKNYVIVGLTIAVVVALSGWWLTARDHSSTERNGTVGDCRALEFARTLDGFLPFVTPNHTERDRDEAAAQLQRLGKLLPRYQACTDADRGEALRITAKRISLTTTTTPARFTSCAAARDAGAAPLHRGDPGYSVTLDADRDGIACE